MQTLQAIQPILLFVMNVVVIIIIGIVGWSIKTAVSDMKDSIKKNAEDIAKVTKDLSDLKSDLPLVYTLREDFIRTLNNVDKQMNNISDKLDKILHFKAGKEE